MDTTARLSPAARIKELRLNRELTQKQLALALSVEAVTVSRWERGEVPPSDLNRVRLGRFFCVHPNEFLADEGRAA
jgi:transcriptional regulator with XRE-family HTH domain